MECLADWKANLKMTLKNIHNAETERDGIDIAEAHVFHNDVSQHMILEHAQKLYPELFRSLQIEGDISRTELLVEISSIITAGDQDDGIDEEKKDEEEEEEDDQNDRLNGFIVSDSDDDDQQSKSAKRKHDDDEEEECDHRPISASVRKHIRALKTLKPNKVQQHLFDAIFALEREPLSTFEQLWPAVDALSYYSKGWPRQYQREFFHIQEAEK
jgi:hypothetical protein